MPEEWTIGWHEVTYTDETKVKLPVIYGYNIRSGKNNTNSSSYADAEAVGSSDVEVMGATYAEEKNGKTFYKTAYKNQFPEKEIKHIKYISKNGIEVEALY